METKHTEGPWEICNDGVCDHGYLIGKHFDKGTDERQLASAYIRNTCLPEQSRWPDIYPEEKEALANAHLIAAAPDMYEALKEMLADSKRKTWCNQFDNGHKEWSPNYLEAAALEALLKAEGGE